MSALEQPPTQRQLRYLRALAARTATTFATPATRAQASREIKRLQTLSPEPYASGGEEEHEPCLTYATAVAAEEVMGFGASAAWRTRPRPRPPATPPAPAARGELARYTLSAGERAVYAETHRGALRLTDRPLRGEGRAYTVESDLREDDERSLSALIADYLRRAAALDEVPMASAAVRASLAVGS